MKDAIRVCIDARVPSGVPGGVETLLIGLTSALSGLPAGKEEYLLLTTPGSDEWLYPYLGAACRILHGPPVPRQPQWKRWLNANLPMVRKTWHSLTPFVRGKGAFLPRSDGTIERAAVDVMHFTWQAAFLTEIPSIYHPHDLQHLHLPHFFSAAARRVREITYRAFCAQARMVTVTSTWCKLDLIRHYGLSPDKVQVVPLAPALSAFPTPSDHDLTAVRQKFSLPERFIFYPAQTWPHKNHLGLLEALAILRDKHSMLVPFVSSGHLNDFFPRIQKRARQLRLMDQSRFLGFVTPMELVSLYKLCRCVVLPTEFEAGSFPLWEAFLTGVPAACSNVTSLPEQAGDAALIFDPSKPDQIAAAIARLWTDDALCRQLVERGRRRVAQFTWDRTARLFRAHYRRIADKPLTDEDRSLLQAPPLV